METEDSALGEDVFHLTAAVTAEVNAFPEYDAQPAGEEVDDEAPADPADADAFVLSPWPLTLMEVGGEAVAPEPEPGYFLYWYGEGDTAYWLSDQPIPDFNGVLVAGGEALYAQFGQLGTYMDMDIALGYGGIRPIEQAATLHLVDPAANQPIPDFNGAL